MKIGDIEVIKILPSQRVDCLNGCGNATVYFNGTPYCGNCLHEEQQKKWDADGSFFVNNEGERVYFRIVRKVA